MAWFSKMIRSGGIKMGKKACIIVLLGIFIFSSCLLAAKEPEPPEKYRKWIKEEAVYIITPNEREVFYKLETDKERDMFIELFWRQRDSTPGTPRNEFKEEHYRRIEYANKNFKRYTSLQGWQTDRGRIYIALGEPISIEKYHHTSETYPLELWYYYGNPKFGQAPIFRLLFVRKYGVGPFELYNPIADGPKALTPMSSMRLPPSKVAGIPPQWLEKVKDPQDLAAYAVLRDSVSFELAEASFSSFPGRDGPDFMLPSSILISEVKVYPQKKVQDDYAYEFLEHKAIVEVDYSVNYINSLSLIQILEHKPGMFFLNYCIEPEVLSLDRYQDKFNSNLKTTIRLTDLSERTIVQHSRNFPIELEKEQLKKIGERPFHLYDSFPLVPGDYRFNLLLENMASKEFTSVDMRISVPDPESLAMTPLILARKVNSDSSQSHLSKAFQVEHLQVYPSLRKRFSTKEKLFVFFQIMGLDKEWEEKGTLEFCLYKDDQKISVISKKTGDYGNRGYFLEEISLEDFPPGSYSLKVAFFDAERERLTETERFIVAVEPFAEPWVVSQPNPSLEDPIYFYILGNQYLNKGEYSKACGELKKAIAALPGSLDCALSYAKALLILKDFQKAREVLLPFSRIKKANFALYYYLGKCSQELRDFEEAISYYQNALSHKGNIIEVLNSIGECYFQSGNKEQALRAWQKSLEVNPHQEKIRETVKALKEKK